MAPGQQSPKAMMYAQHMDQVMADRRANPEVWQKQVLDEKLIQPLEAKLEAAPTYVQAPLALAAAANEFNKGDLRLGKYAGGKVYGGRDGIRYEHDKYGNFEVGDGKIGWNKKWTF